MNRTILVCCGTGCLANGSKQVADEFEALIARDGIDAKVECYVKRTGCNGFCENGPIVKIMPDDIIYYKVREKDVPEILEKTVVGGEAVERLLYKNDEGQRVKHQHENPFYTPQHKIALRNIGAIDPTRVEDYIATGGYEAVHQFQKKEESE